MSQTETQHLTCEILKWGSGHCTNDVMHVGGECGAKSGQPVDLSVDGDAVFQESPHLFSLASQVTDTKHETGEAFTREVEITPPLPHLTPDSASD